MPALPMALRDDRATFAGWTDILPLVMSKKALLCPSGGDLTTCVARVIMSACIIANFPVSGAN